MHDICNLRHKIPKEIPVKFHNGSTYYHHFIIKQLAKKTESQFECLGESTERYITFSVPIKKEVANGKAITYKLQFIDSFRFTLTSLSKLVKYLSDGLHGDKCTDCESHLDYMLNKDDQLIFRCFEYKKTIRNTLIKN